MQNYSWPLKYLHYLNRSLCFVTSVAAILVVPLAILLFAQWPLRDWLHAYSREANDIAQLLFGVYVSAGITYATRVHAHLTPDVFARRYPSKVRLWLIKLVSLFIVLPLTLFILKISTPMVWQSIVQLEGFPDTYNPGYFILKISVWWLALLIFLQAIVDSFLPAGRFTPQGDQ